MEISFWGVRGSIPAPGPSTVRYGGNTACVSLRAAGGGLLVLDCGTGARNLGMSLMEAGFGQGRGEVDRTSGEVAGGRAAMLAARSGCRRPEPGGGTRRLCRESP